MSNEPNVTIGHIGNISDIKGTVVIGGDAVQGDKVIGNKVGGNFIGGNSVAASSPLGFATEAKQTQFIGELESLRKAIVEAKSQIELDASEQPGAEALMQELSKLVKELQAAKAQASEFPVGQAAPPEKAKTMEDYLNKAGHLIEKAQQFGEKVAELSIKLTPLVSTLWALLKF